VLVATGLIVAGGMLAWLSLAVGLAVVIGRGIRQADQAERRAREEALEPLALLGVVPPPRDRPVNRPGG
jgi:hypothetical protein